MTTIKIFKDPIYGYVDIEGSLVKNIIDTATFQRLRKIKQTSYEPLYLTALHNRFVHSLGVYHLGKLVAESLMMSIKEVHKSFEDKKLRVIRETFLYACLLHDVGHAPFSHNRCR